MALVGNDHGIGKRAAPRVVELVHQRRIADEPVRRRHIFEAHPRPDPVGAAEGVEAGFLRDAGAGQDDDLAIGEPDGAMSVNRRQV